MQSLPKAALLGAAVATAAAFGTTAVVFSEASEEPPPKLLRTQAPDSAPASTPSVEARTNARGGGQVGVATYRNSVGQLCAAFGRSDEGQLVDLRGRAVPLERTGSCDLSIEPLTVQLINQADDPSTPGDEESLFLWGVAPRGARAVEYSVGSERGTRTPTRDGAFVAALPPQSASTASFKVRRGDGKETTLTLAMPPALEALPRGTDEHATHP